MKVLHIITPRHLGGAELLAMRIMREHSTMGVTSKLITKPHSKVEAAARDMGLDVSNLPIGGKINLPAVGRLLKEMQSFQPDIVCTHLSTASLWGGIAARIAKVPCVAIVHGFNSPGPYRFANILVSVSQAVADSLEKKGVPTSRLRVIYNGIDPRPYSTASPAEFGVPHGCYCVGTVAHLSAKKGYRELLKTAALLPDTHFAFVGEGPLRAEIEQAAEAPSTAGRIHLLGFRTDIPDLMARFDVMCLPSWEEPFGLVVLEAMAAAKPVVAFASGGLPEIIVHGRTGLLAAPGDVNGLAAHLKVLGDDPLLRAEMGQAGLERVQSFTLAETSSKWYEIFRDTIQTRRS